MGVPHNASMGLETRATGPWRFVNTKKRVTDRGLTHHGLLIWPSKYQQNAVIHNVTVCEGSWDAQARNIQVLPTYNVEKTLRIGGVEYDGQSIFTNGKRPVGMPNTISDFTALLLKPDTRVISPSPTDALTYLNVVYNAKEEHLAVSWCDSVIDLPFMLGLEEPVNKVCLPEDANRE